MRSISGVVFAERRIAVNLTQGELAERVGIETQTQHSIERGHKSPSIGTAAREFYATAASPKDVDKYMAAKMADEICRLLLTGDESVWNILSVPLEYRIGHWLAIALSKDGAFTPQEKEKVVTRLRCMVDAALSQDGVEAVSIRNQGYYYLARSGSLESKQFLKDVYRQEHHPIGQRSIAIGQAFLGDRDFLRKYYVERLRDDDQEERRNLGYMAYWAGERKVRVSEVYSDSGEWTGKQTLNWLIHDLVSEPELLELNLHSLHTLLVRKDGRKLFEGNSPTVRRLAGALYSVGQSGVISLAMREDLRKIKRVVDNVLA